MVPVRGQSKGGVLHTAFTFLMCVLLVWTCVPTVALGTEDDATTNVLTNDVDTESADGTLTTDPIDEGQIPATEPTDDSGDPVTVESDEEGSEEDVVETIFIDTDGNEIVNENGAEDEGGDDVALTTQKINDNSGIWGGCSWEIKDGKLIISGSGTLKEPNAAGTDWPWLGTTPNSVVIESGVKGSTSLMGMFRGMTSLVSADLSLLNTADTTNVSQMFDGCTNLQRVDLTGMDSTKFSTSKVDDISVFAGVNNMRYFKVGSKTLVHMKNFIGDRCFDLVPTTNANDGQWWSTKDKFWVNHDIIGGRYNVADTYTSYKAGNTDDLHVAYSTHVQTYGWRNVVQDGATSGSTGESKRLEAIRIDLVNPPYEGSIRYRTHVQKYGWLDWSQDGKTNGTSGESKRMEAIQIELTGEMGEAYDIWYRVHAQTYGWMGWAKNGARAGTATYGKRLEAIQIKILPKGSGAPGSTKKPYASRHVKYRTHVQTYGWRSYVYDGDMSGTTGESKRLEAIQIMLTDQFYDGSVEYRTHVQTYGWEDDYKADGQMSGTKGKSKRLEAIQIRLTGDMADHYDIYYRVHAQVNGWMGWAKNDEPAGTAGYARRLEGIEIKLVTKGGKAPGSTKNAYKVKNS